MVMGGGASVDSSPAVLWCSALVRDEYERYSRQVAEGTEEDLGYDLEPLDEGSLAARFDVMYKRCLEEKEKVLAESVEGLHPVSWVSKYAGLSEAQKEEYCKAVVEAQVQLDKATYKPKAAEADYSKSFSGSAADTKAEKEAAALMKGEGGEGEDEEEKEEDMNPLLRPPSVTYNKYIGNPDLIKRYDRLMLLRATPWCKWFSQSGCYFYIQIATKEIVSIRPNNYEENEDMGGGILTEEELNGTSDDKASAKPKGGEVIPDGVMVCTMKDLPNVLDEVVDDKKMTPLILDPSEDRKVKTFFDYKYRVADASPLCVPFAKSGLKRADCLESYRKTLVGALKAGTTFALYLGDLTSEEANFKKKMCKKDCFPMECMVEAGKKLLAPPFDPRYKKIMKAEDIDENGGDTLKNPEGFRSVVISALKPSEYESKLTDSLALGYMQPIYVSSA